MKRLHGHESGACPRKAWRGLTLLLCLAAAGQTAGQTAGHAAPSVLQPDVKPDGQAAPEGGLEDLAVAREAVKRGYAAAALRPYARVLALRPDDADVLIEVARVHGFADRNAAAAALYQRALVVAPTRRADILPSLAYQLLWSAQAAAALPLFEEWARSASDSGTRSNALDGLGQARNAQGDLPGALAAFTEAANLHPQDIKLQRRRAYALLWNERHAEALALLRQLAAAAPSDASTSWALANALNFSGWHREAIREFLHWPYPEARGERADLARAWRWAGFEERARRPLRDQEEAEAAWLRDYRVQREMGAQAYVSEQTSVDRDRLLTRTTTVGGGLRINANSDADLQQQQLRLSDPRQRLTASHWQAAYRWRTGAVNAPFGTRWTTFMLGQTRLRDWAPVLPTLRLRWVPQDRWRVDAQAGRELVLTPAAVASRVSVDSLSSGLEFRPDARVLLSSGLAVLRFDDGTSRWRANGRAEYAWQPRPRAVLGVEALQLWRTHLGTARERGYWNPKRAQEVRLYVGWQQDARPFDWKLRLGAGLSSEVDTSGLTTRGRPLLLELDGGWDLNPALRLSLTAGASGYGLGLAGGGAGYWRRYLNVSLNGYF